MKVSTLKQLLEQVPADSEVVMQGPDHSYTPIVRAHPARAGYSQEDDYFGEWQGPDAASPGEKEVLVVVLY